MQHARHPLSLSTVAMAALAVSTSVAAADDPSGFRFGGQQRTRYETLNNQFRAGYSNSDQALALQTSLTFDWRGDGLQVFGEIMDSRVELNDAGSFANTSTTNTLEPIQAFVAWRHGASTFKAGRFTQDIGRRRLIARARYGNTVASFAGLDWSWSGEGGRAVRAFHWIPLRILPTDLPSVLDNDAGLDHGTRGSTLSGIFYQFPMRPNGLRLETYLFDYELDSPGAAANAADHRSFGARAYNAQKAGEWSYEAEGILQRGTSGGTVAGVARSDLAHSASLLHLELGYTFDRKAIPTVSLVYDLVSGDESPTDLRNERFNTLYGDRRFEYGPTNIYGLISRANLDSPGVRLTFRPNPKWQSMLALRSIALDERRDAWAGSGWRDTAGAAGTHVGSQFEGSLTLNAIPNRLSVEVGFAEVASSRYAKQTAGVAYRGDPHYFYATLLTTF